MRIGIVSFWKNNYGSVLQVYATQTYLRKKGFDVDVLNERYFGADRYIHYIHRKTIPLVCAIKYRGYLKFYLESRKKRNNGQSHLSNVSSNMISNFINRNLQTYECSYSNLKKYAECEDTLAVLCGSDQVWNCSKGFVNPYYFLDFVPDEKKFAIAASFGISEIPVFLKKDIAYRLKKFCKLSVREETGVKIIEDLLKKTVSRLPDPAFILSGNEWREVAKNAIIQQGKYILLHFIDEPSDIAIKTLLTLLDDNEKVICFGYHHKSLEHIDNIVFEDGGPEEYIKYIDKAKYVLTDSFHTCVFSINLETNFLVFERQYKQLLKQNSRIQTLLTVYSYQDHYILSEDQISEVTKLCLHNVNDIMESERESIENYFSSILPNSTRNHDLLRDKKNCSGCGACVSVCQYGAISINKDENGFDYPEIKKEYCVNCKRCVKVCNSVIRQNNSVQKAYVAINKDTFLRDESASGGIFSAIAKFVISKGGVVFGAALKFDDNNIIIEHIPVESMIELPQVLGSKYVQSDCYKTFPLIKKILKESPDRKVLFGGTSCQVDALYRFLGGIETSNLLTIDLICHGVPSKHFFKSYIQYIEQKYHGKVIDFSFRTKSKNKIEYVETIKFKIKNSTKIVTIPFNKSAYYKLFLLGESYRDSCYRCRYSSIDKPADITIGDYFEIINDYPELAKKYSQIEGCGVSCVITRSELAEKYLFELKEMIESDEVDIKTVQSSHRQLCCPMRYTTLRKKIFDLYAKNGFNSVGKYFIIQDIIRAVPRCIKRLITRNMKEKR